MSSRISRSMDRVIITGGHKTLPYDVVGYWHEGEDIQTETTGVQANVCTPVVSFISDWRLRSAACPS